MSGIVMPAVQELDRAEMGTLLGGTLSDGGEALARDIGTVLGAIVGGLWSLATHPPQASYAYGKVGYCS